MKAVTAEGKVYQVTFIPPGIKSDLQKSWAKNQVDRYLTDLLYWLANGYVLSGEQRKKFEELYHLIGGEQ